MAARGGHLDGELFFLLHLDRMAEALTTDATCNRGNQTSVKKMTSALFFLHLRLNDAAGPSGNPDRNVAAEQ